MKQNEKIFVAGHNGFVGSAIVRRLAANGYENVLTCPRTQVDLTNQKQVAEFFKAERPTYVFIAAGRIGGIYATNTYRGDFIYQNLMIASNLIHHAYLNETNRLMFVSCSGVYPKYASHPVREDQVLTGLLDTTGEPSAIANIAGLKLCESYNRQYGTDFLATIPTNLYGPRQSYEPLNTTVIPSLIRRFHEAKVRGVGRVKIWGTGRPRRDFLYVDDFADAMIFLMQEYIGNDVLNIGTGADRSIFEAAMVIKDVIGYDGEVIQDASKPDSRVTKKQDLTKIMSLKWTPKVEFKNGIQKTYEADKESLQDSAIPSIFSRQSAAV